MENKIKNVFMSLKASDKRLKILVALGLVGVLLIMLSEAVPDGRNKKETIDSDFTYEEYIASLENKTEKLVSSIDGAGRCNVMITLKDTNESVFAKNSDESSSDSSYSSLNTVSWRDIKKMN